MTFLLFFHSHSNEVPILWLRVDPDFQWIRQLTTEQSDTTWQNMLKYERDAAAQLDALQALAEYPSPLTRDCFRDTILNPSFYYQVRLRAAQHLVKVGRRPYNYFGHLGQTQSKPPKQPIDHMIVM